MKFLLTYFPFFKDMLKSSPRLTWINHDKEVKLNRDLVRHLFQEVNHPLDTNLIELALAGYFKDDPASYCEQSLRIIHHLSLDTWTGYYSIEFRELIKQPRNWARLPCFNLEEFFPEIKSLNTDEQNLVRERILFEREVLRRAFNFSLEEIRSGHRTVSEIRLFLPLDFSNDIDERYEGDSSIYELFFRQLSLQQRIKEPWFEMLDPVTSSPVKHQLVFSLCPRSSNSSEIEEITSLEMHELLRAVNQGQINPRTHLPLDPLSVELIRTNYPIELKLVH